MASTTRRNPLIFFAAAAFCTAAVIAFQALGFWSSFDARLRDKLIEKRPASKEIVIVAIDNASIQEFGVWPWPRTLHAEMIRKLTDLGAKQIGYDVTFSESSSDAKADDALAQAINDSGRVVLASEAELEEHKDAFLREKRGNYFQFSGKLEPLPMFREAARAYGITTLLPEYDGVIRRSPQLIRGVDRAEAAFASQIAALRAPLDVPPFIYRIPYVGGPGSFDRVSFADVINGRAPMNRFNGKIVLVGSTAPDLHDEFLTPMSFGQPMPGVEIQANIIQGLMEGRILNLPSSMTMAAILFALAAAVSLVIYGIKLRYAALAVSLIAFGYIVIALVAASRGALLPVLYPLLVIVTIAAADVAYRYAHEKGRRRFIQTAFSRYLAPQVIDKLVSGEAKLELGGVKTELTILFSDIRGFTAISEKLSPEALVALLNEYLTAMTDIVLETEGVVDKYIGDAIMAFWGAPILQPDHAVRAATTAARMRVRLTELKKKWAAEGKPEVNIGIGMNTGPVVVGNMGSRTRFDYTVMGDDVNLASRLEGLTKQYGVTALLSEATRLKLGDGFLTRPIDLVAVKGKKQAIRIHELICRAEDATPAVREKIESWNQALAAYRARRWDEARESFQRFADDGAAKAFAERCVYMKDHDPGAGWDGVFAAKEK
ncbi:adenylate/guanylate cyclase domain-containing protein [Candidatus Uhrbacteria bacterium]|nr:adenylate/guanylate cyclase domain-containing protein [Candidatus Uhrbacteria bacterium]